MFIVLITALVLLCGLIATPWLYMKKEQFGKNPDQVRAERFKGSANFNDGTFRNLSVTPQLAEGHSMAGVMYSFFFDKDPRSSPKDTLPSVKVDLTRIPLDSNILVWFGHSSYYMQLDGRRILVDPVFSGNASPLPGTVPAFPGTDVYAAADLPDIDYLFISHDHYDHLDHETMVALRGRIRKIICGLGVGSHLERWGYNSAMIHEGDWLDTVELDSGFTAFIEPARHFSGRGIAPNKTLWVSFLLKSPTMKIFIGGDSGYDTHYVAIRRRHGPVDLAILENGQYDSAWPYIHHLPDEVLKAARDLEAKRLFPVHSAKFVPANHAWDDPLVQITRLNEGDSIPMVTPVIGEVVALQEESRSFRKWWVGLN
jgi:L-ascorbate metabolism protein UlaG (beta-lactamase superfamily)